MLIPQNLHNEHPSKTTNQQTSARSTTLSGGQGYKKIRSRRQRERKTNRINEDITFFSHQIFNCLPLHVIRDVADEHPVPMRTLLLSTMLVFVGMEAGSPSSAARLLFSIMFFCAELIFFTVSEKFTKLQVMDQHK